MTTEYKNQIVSLDKKIRMAIFDEINLLHSIPVITELPESHSSSTSFFFDKKAAQNFEQMLENLEESPVVFEIDGESITLKKLDGNIHLIFKTIVNRDVEADFDLGELKSFADKIKQLANNLPKISYPGEE